MGSECGWNLDLALQDIDQNLICSVCLNLFKDAVETPCGHTYCYPCLLAWAVGSAQMVLDRAPNSAANGEDEESDMLVSLFACCPDCRANLPLSGNVDIAQVNGNQVLSFSNVGVNPCTRPSRVVRGIVGNIHCRCPNSGVGCDWNGTFQTLENHECMYGPPSVVRERGQCVMDDVNYQPSESVKATPCVYVCVACRISNLALTVTLPLVVMTGPYRWISEDCKAQVLRLQQRLMENELSESDDWPPNVTVSITLWRCATCSNGALVSDDEKSGLIRCPHPRYEDNYNCHGSLKLLLESDAALSDASVLTTQWTALYPSLEFLTCSVKYHIKYVFCVADMARTATLPPPDLTSFPPLCILKDAPVIRVPMVLVRDGADMIAERSGLQRLFDENESTFDKAIDQQLDMMLAANTKDSNLVRIIQASRADDAIDFLA